ncbi:MAG: CinA family protein [Euryarchaeota archaeon]|nr:CinA family protein [Euryarchaeota archaeon]
MNEDDTLERARAVAERVLDTARRARLTLTTAESCTGGLLASLITDIPGSSSVYLGGWVTYADRIKSARLDIDPKLIETHGAVSETVAKALAENARRLSGADHAVATTGIAGPTGGSHEKPVGLVWIGIAGPNDVRASRHQVDGDRRDNKASFALYALTRLEAALEAAGAP